jgi:hypothetical protein
MITVNGKRYKVTENMGFQNGYYVKAVMTENGERICKRTQGTNWEFTSVISGIYKSDVRGQSDCPLPEKEVE